jgi:cell division protein FtsB|tara:strand:+ start:277 stop:507 length:231 start_codon:yes stop_codon:yes gene_type:complete
MNRVATYIIAIISVALLIYNQVLIEDIKQHRITNIKLQYKVLDLQSEYDYLFDETLRLEDENQLLGSYVAYSDTLY